MRCLSVRQPWAWAICSGQKNIENRTWGTDYRGQIAIHAGSSKDGLNSIRKRTSTKLDHSLFPLGAIIGVAEVVDCVLLNEDLEDNPWASGPECWVLANAQLLANPIPMKGKLNLFELDPEISAEVEKQLTGPAPTQDRNTVEQIVATIQTPLIDLRQWQMNAYVELRDVDSLQRLSSRVIEEFPESDLGYRYRAVALVELGEWKAAIADATKAIELDPANFMPLHARAIARLELGDVEGARADWQRAKELGAEIPEFEALERGEA